MSEGNVETFTGLIDEITRRDVDAVLARLDPDVRWHSAILVPLGGETRVASGHAGVAAMFGDFYDVFPEIALAFSEVRDLGGRVLALGEIHVRGAGSSVEMTFPWAYVVEFANGKVAEVRTFSDWQAALDAAGVESSIQP